MVYLSWCGWKESFLDELLEGILQMVKYCEICYDGGFSEYGCFNVDLMFKIL